MSVEWPKKKDEISESTTGFCSMYRAEGWNACHDAFMKVIEAKEGETSNDIAFQKGYAAGMKASPQLIPLDEEKIAKEIFRISNGILKTSMVWQIAGMICFTFGQSKEKLVPLDVIGCMEALKVIESEINQRFKNDHPCVGQWRNRPDDITYFKSKLLCHKFGIPPQPKAFTFEELDLIMFNECPSGDELIRRRYAQAIFERIKGGK